MDLLKPLILFNKRKRQITEFNLRKEHIIKRPK